MGEVDLIISSALGCLFGFFLGMVLTAWYMGRDYK